MFSFNPVRVLGRKVFVTPWSAKLVSYLRVLEKINTFPPVMYVGITNDCNLKCIMCRRKMMVKEVGYIEMDLYRAIVDELAEVKAVSLFPMGLGEPLMHPQFLRMLEYARHKEIAQVNVVTNAMLLSEEFARGMIELGLHEVHCSVDTIQRGTYSKIRPGGDLEVVVENILRFVDLRNSRGKEFPRVVMRVIFMPQNKDEHQEYLDFWTARLSPNDMIRIGRRSKFTKANIEKRLRDPYPPCSDLWKSMGIRWDGKFVLCGGNPDNTLGLDAFFPERSIRDVWNSDHFNRMRRMHLRGRKMEIPSCGKCISPFYIKN